MAGPPEPFRSSVDGGVFTAVLDTPGCDVNIFSQEAALQLLELTRAAREGGAEAFVLRSSKPGSFINGVGLMMASTVRRPEDVGELTEVIRAAYRALEDLPMPTIAAVQGNCFGCGVELSLRCDHRVAERSWDTQFYMTEVADYLFVPCFGGTQHLPRLLGLEKATDFLLWGERWSADAARQHGLVDDCFEAEGFDAELAGFLDAVRTARRTPRPRGPRFGPAEETLEKRTDACIEALPESYQPVYRACFDRMLRGARADVLEAADFEEERLAAGRSVGTEQSKSAQSFFFIRQLAERRTLRHAPVDEPRRLRLEGLAEVAAEMRRRRVRNVTVTEGTAGEGGLHLAPYAHPSASDAKLALEPVRGPIDWSAEVIVYAPWWGREPSFVEVAVRNDESLPAASLLADILARSGFVPILSRPERRFAVEGLIDAFLAPLHAYVEQGGTPERAERALRSFGFLRSLAALAEHGGSRLAPAREPSCAARADAQLVDAVLVSLLAFVRGARRRGVLSHPSLADLAAREVLDFPLGRGSLCRYLTPSRVADLLERRAGIAPFVPPPTLETAERYVTEGESFYR
ncbi:MAG: enoyl-CoA hydratase/isomerase family protein [Myxococcota bacterium]